MAAAQNYKNHRRIVPLFHGVLFLLIVITLIGACVNLAESWDDPIRIYSASLLVVLSIALLMLFFFARTFALKAQDRAIRAEENLRYFAVAGKLMPAGLSIKQVVALRFASDGEFRTLVERAAKDQLAPDDIKKAIQVWRPDLNRV